MGLEKSVFRQAFKTVLNLRTLAIRFSRTKLTAGHFVIHTILSYHFYTFYYATEWQNFERINLLIMIMILLKDFFII